MKYTLIASAGAALLIAAAIPADLRPAQADDLAACSFAPTCPDTTPDYQLIIAFGRYGAVSITSTHFEDEVACTTAGDAARKYLPIDEYFKVTAVCAAEASAQ